MKKLIIYAAALLVAAGLQAQTVRHTMRFQGQEREYWLYVPDSLCAQRPLVFMLHGYGGKADGYFPAMIDCARRPRQAAHRLERRLPLPGRLEGR